MPLMLLFQITRFFLLDPLPFLPFSPLFFSYQIPGLFVGQFSFVLQVVFFRDYQFKGLGRGACGHTSALSAHSEKSAVMGVILQQFVPRRSGVDGVSLHVDVAAFVVEIGEDAWLFLFGLVSVVNLFGHFCLFNVQSSMLKTVR